MKTIVLKGEVQLSAAERKEKMDKKRAEVLDHIHKYTLDPKTNLPHPMVRIENAISQLKVKIDSELPADKQAMEILKVFTAVVLVFFLTLLLQSVFQKSCP